MKIILSPAKTLDMETPLPTEQHTQPLFKNEIHDILKVMRSMNAQKLGTLMDISENLAQLNAQRFQEFATDFTTQNARPAIYTFAGDVYAGLDAYTLDLKHAGYLQSQVRILSGLYGYLRPLDLMQPYRLEMGTAVAIGKNKNLYAFWKNKLTHQLNQELQAGELVVNLASVEYFKALDAKKLNSTLISPIFKDYKNGTFKVISFFAKKARGSMARFLIEQRATSLNDLLQFKEDGYAYAAAETSNELQPVFTR